MKTAWKNLILYHEIIMKESEKFFVQVLTAENFCAIIAAT
jgi:hypothetical protein